MSWTRWVNSSPTLSFAPSTLSPHHPRTLLMALKTSSGVLSTTKDVVKSLIGSFSFCSGVCSQGATVRLAPPSATGTGRNSRRASTDLRRGLLLADPLGGGRESEEGKQRGLEEGMDGRNATVGDLEDVDTEGFEHPRRPHGPVHGEPRTSVGGDLEHPIAATLGAHGGKELPDVGNAPQPKLERRHAQDRLLVQERYERVDVVTFEGLEVAAQQLLVGLCRLGGLRVGPDPPQGAARSTKGAVDGVLAGLEQLGDFLCPEAQHVAEDEHRPLPGQQVLEGDDEGQPDRLPGHRHLGWLLVGR